MITSWDERARAIAETCKSYSKAEVAQEIVKAMQYAYSKGYKAGIESGPIREDMGR